ncbi:MAG: HlyD family efflux transporter periplasmic adaptor subunit [Rhodobacterales bacterium]|nr:HlyD family efflux transporter periplasmic adaptor subunit [Rhodobacterales bacterium]
MKQYRNLIGVTAFAAVLLLAGCGNAAPENGEHGQGHEADVADDYARGPHNGRLLDDDDFAVEVTIFETGVPPQFRIYPYRNGAPADPSGVDLTVRLHRLGDIVDEFSFTPRQDYLMGDGVVIEPHSFEVEVIARHSGKTSNWRYESFEGRTTIPDDIAEEAGVAVEDAGPASIRDVITVSGTVELSPSATAEVRARYPGPMKSVNAKVGDYVRRGQPLAVVESSSSLQEYTVLAPVSGTILERHTNAGDVAGSEALFVIADFTNAEARLHVFPRDVSKVKPGQKVRLGVAGGDLDIETTITRFLPITGAESQTRIAVAGLPADTGLQPGMRIMAEVTTAETDVPLAVRESGLQSFRDFTVVYAKVDETYEVRMLEIGRRDGQYAEILGGLKPGETYVTDNSYLIKADIEKSGASHDH